ncbi:MAG: Protein translocase subunit SecY [Patescibacteria group bacterium]|jgi:preprotein translocase subunit SecY|nr:Protein translocase subunit SecY [Patescibacteria group bacterium]
MNTAIFSQMYKNKDLRKRLIIVLAILAIYSLLAHVPVPVPDTGKLQNFLLQLFQSNPLLGFANLFTGGALSNFSILLMGLGPYINASIIIQLLSQVVPQLEALQKEGGEAGRRKINYYTRLLTLPLALIQSVAMITLARTLSQQIAGVDLIGSPTIAQWALMIASITGGSMLLMWLGEIVTDKGIGNGISILILAGIVSNLPTQIIQQVSLAQADGAKIFTFAFFVAVIIVVVFFVVMLNEGQRNIPISYARRIAGDSRYGGVDSHLPIRLITAGVIPIIFALAFLSLPGFLGQLFSDAKTAWVASIANWMNTAFQPNKPIYTITYFVLVFAFTYFYTAVVFKPNEIAENLQKQGGFITGIRPGVETSKYLKRIITRLTLFGALALGLLAVFPFVIESIFKTENSLLSIGGTGILIIVAVIIETIKQIESRALMATYEKY